MNWYLCDIYIVLTALKQAGYSRDRLHGPQTQYHVSLGVQSACEAAVCAGTSRTVMHFRSKSDVARKVGSRLAIGGAVFGCSHRGLVRLTRPCLQGPSTAVHYS